MYNVKKIGSLVLLAVAAALVCVGCSGDEQTKLDFSNSTIVGLVTEISGSKVTLQLGGLVEQEPPAPLDNDAQNMPGGDKPPAKPDGDQGNGEPPAKPDCDQGNGEPPAKPDGDQGNGEPPAKPEGEVQTMQLQTNGGTKAMIIPQNMPAGGGSQPNMLLLGNVVDTAAQNEPPEPPAGGKPNALYTFEAGVDTVTLNLADATVSIEEQMQTREGSLADIAVGDVLELEIGEKNAVLAVTVKNLGSGNMGGTVEQGTAMTLLSSDCVVHNETYISTADDENALRVDGASASLTEVSVQKNGGDSSNVENGDFYGQNAALLATNGALVTIDNSNITSRARNGNGVFSYGNGTVVSISDSVIRTTHDNSGGLQTTGGATMNAVDLDVRTEGSSSAAIRSDRGGGTVNVIGGKYVSTGYNSPAVYSTADITVMNAELTAENSEALVIEGKNSIELLDCTVSGNMSDSKGASSDENVHNVMIYQSMSGDAAVGTSEFSAQGGSITGHSGDMFYVTNTHCLLTLDGVSLQNEADGQLLRVCGNTAKRGWGKAGANGAQVEFLAKHQEMQGDITVDTISTLDFQLSEGSVFTGSLNIVPNEQGGAAVPDNLTVRIDEGCVWNLTSDCVITSLENNGTINENGYKLTTGGLANN